MAQDKMEQKPKTVGQYYIMEKVAQGGMAEIFRGLAYDVHGISQREVCIKKILPHLSADKEFIDSLIDEAKLAVRLVHGNIAQTYDLGKVGDDYYMVMEYVEGATLSQINKRCISKGQLIPIQHLVYFVSEVAQGLDYMHRRTDEGGVPLHIVHRDISPQNIMVSFSGTVKIIDFGIAKPAFKASGTDSGLLKGKFAYMSPEQALGDEIDHRSDIFSLGVILHEMLTGKRLFKAAESRETIRNVRKALVEPVANIRPEVPEELDRIVMRALTKDRRHRYPYASEFRDDLVKFLHRHYPDFKTADAANFVQELYRNEMGKKRPVEADSKTPALIIDRTNSALAGDEQFEVTGVAKAPANIKEFMLDEESASAAPPEEAMEAAEEEHTADRPPPEPEPPKRDRGGRPPKGRSYAKILVPALALIAVASYFGLRLYMYRPAGAPGDEGAAKAGVMVTTEPADALVALDGRTVGKGSPVTLRDIEPERDYSITVSKEGYFPDSRTIRLADGEFKNLSVKLRRKAPPYAEIELISNPPGAVVFMDDKQTALRTPATLEKIDVRRPHTVGLYLEGYKFWNKRLELKEGQSKSFDVALTKDYGSALVDSQPQGSLVIIDGAPVGTTPLTKEELEPGRVYKLQIWHEGYRPSDVEFKPKAGAQKEIRVTLTPLGPGETSAPPPAP